SFSTINRGGLIFAWEPLGKNWTAAIVRSLCEVLNITHTVDPFASEPAFLAQNTAYLRLHGAPPGKKMYRYTYSDSDLYRLRDIIQSINAKQCYLLFNNITMREDALRFQKLL
ncbi:MAG: DUF72 domain-containing protein, partial [Candidatus Freyarchaeota archaeon]